MVIIIAEVKLIIAATTILNSLEHSLFSSQRDSVFEVVEFINLTPPLIFRGLSRSNLSCGLLGKLVRIFIFVVDIIYDFMIREILPSSAVVSLAKECCQIAFSLFFVQEALPSRVAAEIAVFIFAISSGGGRIRASRI